jgi:hypothetical protein
MFQSSSSSSSSSSESAAGKRRQSTQFARRPRASSIPFLPARRSTPLPDVADAFHSHDGSVWWCLGGNRPRAISRSHAGSVLPGEVRPNGLDVFAWTVPARCDALPFDAWLLAPGTWTFAPVVRPLPFVEGTLQPLVGAAGGAVAVDVDALRFAVLDPRCPVPVSSTVAAIPPLPGGGGNARLHRRLRSPVASAVTSTGIAVVGTCGGKLLVFDLKRDGAQRPIATIDVDALVARIDASMSVMAGTEPTTASATSSPIIAISVISANTDESTLLVAFARDTSAFVGVLDTVAGVMKALNAVTAVDGALPPLDRFDHGCAVTAVEIVNVEQVHGSSNGHRGRVVVSVASTDMEGDVCIWSAGAMNP